MVNFVELLGAEITENLTAMAKTKDLDQKKAHSEIVLNLCKSMGTFMDAMHTFNDNFIEEDLDLDDFDFDEPHTEEPHLELHQPKQKKKRKK